MILRVFAVKMQNVINVAPPMIVRHNDSGRVLSIKSDRPKDEYTSPCFIKGGLVLVDKGLLVRD